MFKSPPISAIFGNSPVKPLQIHMAVVVECAQKLIPFLNATQSGDFEKAQIIFDEIKVLENKADDFKHKLRLELPRSLFLPVPREDLLSLLTAQDQVANISKDISGLILGRKMQFPYDLSPLLIQFTDRCIDAAEQADKTVNELDELVETGFSGNEITIVADMIDVLDAIENETDELQAELRKRLFAIEDDIPPVHCMFLYQAISLIGELGDESQRVGSRLQLLLAK